MVKGGTTKNITLSIDEDTLENLEIVIIETGLINEAMDVSVLNRVSFWGRVHHCIRGACTV